MRLSLFIVLCLYSLSLNAQDLVPYNNNGLWGFYSTNSQQALELKYQETRPFRGNIAMVKKGNKWGAVNTNLSVVITPDYDQIEFINKDLLSAKKAGMVYLYNAKGLRLFPESLREATLMRTDSNLLVVQNLTKKYGVLTTKGEIVIPIRYAYAPEHITPDHLLISEDSFTGPLFGVLNKKGRIIIPFRFDMIQLKSDYSSNDKKFYECITPSREVFLYDLNGKLMIHGNYDRIWTYGNLTLVEKNKKIGIRYKELPTIQWMDELSSYKDGFVIGRTNKKLSFVNPEGKLIVVAQYDELQDFKGGLGLVKKTDQEQGQEHYGLIDRNGRELVPPVYHNIESWNNKYAAVRGMDHKTGLIELSTKKAVLPFKYDQIVLLSCGNLLASLEHNTHMLDANFKEIPGVVFETMYFPDYSNKDMENDLIRVRNRKKGKELFGFVNCHGKIILPVEYEEINSIKDMYGNNPLGNIYNVTKRDSIDGYQSGLVRHNGEFMVPLRAGRINYYNKKYIEVICYVKMDGESRALRGIIDTTGKEIVPCSFDAIAILDIGFTVTHNERSGFYNKMGKQVIPPTYHAVVPLGKEYFIVSLWNKQGIFDINGKQITEIKYEEVNKEGFENGVFKARLNGKTIYVGMDGKEYLK